jgi:hypothetical protein
MEHGATVYPGNDTQEPETQVATTNFLRCFPHKSSYDMNHTSKKWILCPHTITIAKLRLLVTKLRLLVSKQQGDFNYCRGFFGLWFSNLTCNERCACWRCLSFCSINSINNTHFLVILSYSLSSLILFFFPDFKIMGNVNPESNLESLCTSFKIAEYIYIR